VAEARHTYRIRDERGAYCNGPARGIARLGLLEAGRRLAERGRLEAPEHLLEADRRELEQILSSPGGPTAKDLRERYEYRVAGAGVETPMALGGPPPVPVNLEWLPPGIRRIARAMAANGVLGVGGGAAREAAASGDRLTGAAAAPGRYVGRAAVVRGADELELVEPGDVLVTPTTSSSYNVVFPLLGAVVTDWGGPLSHAAIMSREFGIPCVAGCGKATSFVRAGATITVDGTAGTVEIAT
jgi:pyruvate,water dikinase